MVGKGLIKFKKMQKIPQKALNAISFNLVSKIGGKRFLAFSHILLIILFCYLTPCLLWDTYVPNLPYLSQTEISSKRLKTA